MVELAVGTGRAGGAQRLAGAAEQVSAWTWTLRQRPVAVLNEKDAPIPYSGTEAPVCFSGDGGN